MNNLIACFVGCVIAGLVGLLLILKSGVPALAMLTAAALPSLACYLAGINEHRQLMKIAVYAGVGWALGYMLQPVVAETSASHVRRIMRLPLLGYDWHIHASVISTILALIGVYFVPEPTCKTPANDDVSQNDKRDTQNAGQIDGERKRMG